MIRNMRYQSNRDAEIELPSFPRRVPNGNSISVTPIGPAGLFASVSVPTEPEGVSMADATSGEAREGIYHCECAVDSLGGRNPFGGGRHDAGARDQSPKSKTLPAQHRHIFPRPVITNPQPLNGRDVSSTNQGADMNAMHDELESLSACAEGLAWAKQYQTYAEAWLEADAALQKLQSMTRVGDKAEVEIVLARQKLQTSQALVWDAEPADVA